jgi:hypothetical protein
MELFDPKTVYLVTLHVGEIEQDQRQVMTNVMLDEPGLPDPKGASYYLRFREMAEGPRGGGFYVVGEPWAVGKDGAEVYDREAMRTTRKPCTRRFLPLTRENFSELQDVLNNYTYLDRILRTTADVQYFYREELTGD